MSALTDWTDFYTEFCAWADATIPQDERTPLLKLRHEARELYDEPSAEEASDVLMCLMYYLHRSGIGLEGILAASWEKLAKNKARTWARGADGTWSHVKVRMA